MKVLQDFSVFIETAKQGSITQAANVLNLTPAAVSATIKRLENQFNCVLFIRSTRSIRLTSEGQLMLEKCQQAVDAIESGVESVKRDPSQITGHLRLAMPSDLGRNILLPLLDEFIDMHPKLILSTELCDTVVDLYTRPLDASIRYGMPPDSSMVALPISPNNDRVACASPDYIAKHGKPTHPSELANHNCINFITLVKYHTKWRFSKQGEKCEVIATGNRFSNDGDVVRRWMVAGKGIGYKTRLDSQPDIDSGRLVHLFEDWQGDHIPLNLVVTDKRQLTPALLALKEFLQERLS
ncbi:transcriptional regulator, LysR family protein [Vibrio ichthyoenteri ATCC 700023]|uniref:Transcriptional regulator, LysR family protein n=1 Tax=Vibrio ichthyoenteri ATCC 700023 TaxID=870968 RepID=F9S7Q1_9VIBR|nr:LysR family transcriptional regulator [Vibrio ichthyoenteri]EGU31069.1 transcriptional regulator, LysR family protein [Vibrio ichthyoenteri ATCC 700023]